ncbi:hypothetical protein HGRIS_009808 [Hohenbuehelia grisea]|uniref:FCP1 homology domain-containing protein n=1 Tax=Hohenbuehelia grisea TaxID=104357 RepID=A0ABR3J2F7_9AGAR
MNSLTYLSRQFDVLASPRTPPSTPTTSKQAFIDQEPSLKRIRTWSTKSFLFPPSRKRTAPKRSFSSPADVSMLTLASLQRAAKKSSGNSSQKESPSTLCTPSTSSPPSASSSHLQSVLRRIFFIRIFVMACDALRSAWASLIPRLRRWWASEADVRVIVEVSASESYKSRTGDEDDQHARLLNSTLSKPQLNSLSPPRTIIRHHTDPQPDTPSALADSPPSPASSTSTVASRSPTPILQTRKPPFQLQPKTLVLDLDETLIHSTTRPIPNSATSGGLFGLSNIGRGNNGAGYTVEVMLGGRSTLYHVYKRPFVDFFLRTVSGWYTLVIFTASMQEYADPVIDWLDGGRGILGRRLFRDSCTQLPNGSYTKDLALIEEDLSRVCLIDNSPISYRVNEPNGIPIEGWTNDPSDEALLDLLPVLDSLRFTSDVRRVLGLRLGSGVQ